MASYDNTTGIYTITDNEAPDFLKNLPENTIETPYKINITNITFENNYPIKNIYTDRKIFLDLSPTKIIIRRPETLVALFEGYPYGNLIWKHLVVPPQILNPHNIKYSMDSTFFGCISLMVPPILPEGLENMLYTFYHCENLSKAPILPSTVKFMSGTFGHCKNITTPPVLPNGLKIMYSTFEYCESLTTCPVIPEGVENMDNTFRFCTSLTNSPEIPDSVTNLQYTFIGCTGLTTIDVTEFTKKLIRPNRKTKGLFKDCPNLKEFIYNVEHKENDDWTLYLLKRIGNNLNIKRYSIKTNTLIDEHTISLESNATNELEFLLKSDELLIDSIGNITDQQIDLLLKSRMEFGDKYSLDPQKKWLVVWADNPDNVRSNCFVTQQELKELKALLKTKHPDLF
ncbi:leucine-rich repeat protein [Treponema putidum]|uniref:leucine-rich repeat protein n=1 Tax=Treponema putidum TaxID=221027 RepID=UPI003D93C93B